MALKIRLVLGALSIYPRLTRLHKRLMHKYVGNGKDGYLRSERFCPPKNGVWKIEFDTNFGTYVYELQNRR